MLIPLALVPHFIRLYKARCVYAMTHYFTVDLGVCYWGVEREKGSDAQRLRKDTACTNILVHLYHILRQSRMKFERQTLRLNRAILAVMVQLPR